MKHTSEKWMRIAAATLAGVSMLVSVLLVAPTPALAAACPGGQVATSGGGCCPTGQVQITASGDVNCPASTNPNCSGSVSGNQALACFMSTYLNPAIALVSAAVGIVVVIGIIRGALEYTTAAGDPGKTASGKKHIINALIGLAAYLMLYALMQFIIPGGVLN